MADKRRLISIPFMLLRGTTAGAALVTGLLQTFVFAHVLTPHRFSLFILVGAIGYSLWLIDFGIVKVLFVRLRARFLAKDDSDRVAGHATAVVMFYGALVVVSSLLCFVFMATQTYSTPLESGEFALFFLFVSLNLVWFAMRNIAIAVDEYVLFEALETARRFAYFVGLAAVYIGVSLFAALLALNALWAVVIAVCVKRLVLRSALVPILRGTTARLADFFRANRKDFVGSGIYAGTDIFIGNFPYLIVPMLFGLGAPPIILDTTFKVSRGAAMVFGAISDLLVPRQTAALLERDSRTLVRATLVAAGLCCVPASIACLILIFGADRLFAFLLGAAATMPPETTPIMIVLIVASVAKMVSHSVLVHNGYFNEVARIGVYVVAGMLLVGVYAILVRTDIVHFLEAYTVIYALGAAASVVLMIRGPIHAARSPHQPAKQAIAAEG